MIKFVVIIASLGVTLGIPTTSSNNNANLQIIGGQDTDIEENPWQLALLYHKQHYCGAVEIHPMWALTAAHCLVDAAVWNLAVRAGSTTKSSGGQVIQVVTKYEHSEFNSTTVDYDFALLLLEQPITIQTAAPAALPGPNFEIISGDTAYISGWGLVSSSGDTTEVLRVVKVPIVSVEVCQSAHPQNTITDRMFCAGDMEKGFKDACRGDGGGPVIVQGRLAGLVSWGSGCGRPDKPGVHAKVTSVLDWIYRIVKF